MYAARGFAGYRVAARATTSTGGARGDAHIPQRGNRTGTDEERALLLLPLLSLLLLLLLRLYALAIHASTSPRTVQYASTALVNNLLEGRRSSTVGSPHAEVISRDHRLFFIGQSLTVITSYHSSVPSHVACSLRLSSAVVYAFIEVRQFVRYYHTDQLYERSKLHLPNLIVNNIELWLFGRYVRFHNLVKRGSRFPHGTSSFHNKERRS